MNYDTLDNEELLRLSLEAINTDRDADAVVMLKMLLERDPNHVFGQYLLAAQHAQMGLFDRAEAGFRAVVVNAPDFVIARFQLGQLLVMKGAAAEAKQMMASLTGQTDALGAYARALSAAADENISDAIQELEAGLLLPQEVPALAADMRRLCGQLRQGHEHGLGQTEVTAAIAPGAVPAAPMFLTDYGRER